MKSLFWLSFLNIVKFVENCAPALAPPTFFPPIVPLAPPMLPPTLFSVDNTPSNADYADTDVTVQKDTIVPIAEKSKLSYSLFDLFRPLQLSTASPKTTKIDKLTVNLTISPPVHWTYCDPICGVGDQAVDSDNALENARDDTLEAIKTSCNKAAIKCDAGSLNLNYLPESILVEDFGPYFDIFGNRYRISGKTVAFRINNLNPGSIEPFQIPMKFEFNTLSSITPSQSQTLKRMIVDFLSARKYMHTTTTNFK